MSDPATGETIKRIADADAADGMRALDAAVAASESWAATAPRVRGEILRRAFDLLQERKNDFALLMTLEMGKPLAEARGEVAYGGEFLRWFSEEAVRISGRYGSNPEGTGRMIVSQHPVGPCFLITPWNFPLAMATRKIAPALAAGCTVVIKPAELTPLTTLLLRAAARRGRPARRRRQRHHDLDLGRGVRPDHRRPAPAQAQLHRLDRRSARSSSQQSAAGRAAHLDGARRQRPVRRLRRRRPRQGRRRRDAGEVPQHRPGLHRGQPVHRARVGRRRVRRAASPSACSGCTIGRGTEDGVTIGPLINDDAVDKADALVQDAVGRGAHAAHRRRGASTGPGTFYEPTVLTGVQPGSDILREEIFGPVLAIITVRRRGRGRAPRQRHRVRAGQLRLHRGPRPRPAHDRQACRPA